MGGALMAFGGLPLVVLVDVASYFLSAAAMALLVAPAAGGFRSPERPAEQARFLLGLFRSWTEGVTAIAERPVLVGLLLVTATAVLAQSLVHPLLVPLVKDVLGGGAAEFGWLATAQAVGGIVGGLLLGQLLPRARRGPIVIGFMAVGAIVAALVNIPVLGIAYVLIGLLGIPSVAANIGLQTRLQENAPDQIRGRVFATRGMVQSLVLLVGMAIAGLIADRIGVVATLDIAATVFALAGVIAVVSLRRPTIVAR